MNTAPWDSEPPLTVEELRRAILDAALPDWAKKIRGARAVEVRASQWIEKGAGFVLDPNMSNPLVSEYGCEPRPLMVLCRPEDEERTRAFVERLRATENPNEREGE